MCKWHVLHRCWSLYGSTVVIFYKFGQAEPLCIVDCHYRVWHQAVQEYLKDKKVQKQRYIENEFEVCAYVCSLVGERRKVTELRATENKNSVRDRGRAAGEEQAERMSGETEYGDLSEQWFSLRSGSGVQSLGIDLFKIQSSAIDKLGVLKSPSKPTSAHKSAQASPTTNHESHHWCFFLFPQSCRLSGEVSESSQDIPT